MNLTTPQIRLMRQALETDRIAETMRNLDRKRQAGTFNAGQAAGYFANNVRDAMRGSSVEYTRRDRDAVSAALVVFYLDRCRADGNTA